MANRNAIQFLLVIIVATFARASSAQQLPPVAQPSGSIPTTTGASLGQPPTGLQPSSATPVPVVEERRVVKGADGQWYFVAEDHQPPPTAAEDKGTAAQDDGFSWKSLNDQISKLLTVTIDGHGKLKLYGF